MEIKNWTDNLLDRYWTSPLVVLHVCVLPISGNFTSIVSKPEVLLNAKCQQVNVDRGHRLASLRLPISEFNSKPFIVSFSENYLFLNIIFMSNKF